MDNIIIASPEQVERIRSQSDLGPSSLVLAMGEDLAVVKNLVEIDPVFYANGATNSRKLMFVWGIENWLRLTSTWAYYFNVKAEDSVWRKVVETHGAEAISEAPEIRYKKILNPIKEGA